MVFDLPVDLVLEHHTPWRGVIGRGAELRHVKVPSPKVRDELGVATVADVERLVVTVVGSPVHDELRGDEVEGIAAGA